jgi:hypothetical protein
MTTFRTILFRGTFVSICQANCLSISLSITIRYTTRHSVDYHCQDALHIFFCSIISSDCLTILMSILVVTLSYKRPVQTVRDWAETGR